MERRDGEKKRSAALGPGLAARDPPPPPGGGRTSPPPHRTLSPATAAAPRSTLTPPRRGAAPGTGTGARGSAAHGAAGRGGTAAAAATERGAPETLCRHRPATAPRDPFCGVGGGGGTARPTARCWESRGGGGRAVCACSAGRGGTLRRDGDSVGHGDSAQRWRQCATWGQRAEMGTPSPAARRAARDVRPGRGAQCGCAQSPPCHHSTLRPTRRSPAVLSPRAVAARNNACEG